MRNENIDRNTHTFEPGEVVYLCANIPHITYCEKCKQRIEESGYFGVISIYILAKATNMSLNTIYAVSRRQYADISYVGDDSDYSWLTAVQILSCYHLNKSDAIAECERKNTK